MIQEQREEGKARAIQSEKHNTAAHSHTRAYSEVHHLPMQLHDKNILMLVHDRWDAVVAVSERCWGSNGPSSAIPRCCPQLVLESSHHDHNF